MMIYVICEINYADLETGMDYSIEFYGAYKNKRRAMKKAKELMNKTKKDNLHIDKYIEYQKNPFKRNNWVDFYHDEECQDYRVTSIVLEETKLIV